MLPVIRIGPAAMQADTLALIVALWLGAFIAEREFKRRGMRCDDAWSIIAIAVSATFIAARLAYVAQNFSSYATDWLQIFAPTPGTLLLPIGALMGGITTLIYIQSREIPVARVADGIAPGALTALIVIAFGQLLSGNGFGTPSDLPWAIVVWGALRHPVQMYDALALWLGLMIVWRARCTRAGMSASIAIAWASASRVIVDGWRADADFLPGGYRASQVIALGVLLGALWLIARNDGTRTIADERG